MTQFTFSVPSPRGGRVRSTPSRARTPRSPSPSRQSPQGPRIFTAGEIPIPSIEGSQESVASNHYTTSTPSRLTSPNAPSVVFTPPPSSSPSRNESAARSPSSAGSPVASRRGQENGIEERLGNMRLSSADLLSMGDVAAAVERVANGSDNQVARLRPESQTPERNGSSHRRRSSSRFNRIRHEVQDEEAPHDPFHEPSFQRAFSDAKSLAAEMKDALGNSTLHQDPDSVMRRLHSEAQRLANFQCPSTRTVGFVGDSGVGKSSLLNSLLDFKGLARTSNSGAACTCVVTEYHYHSASNFAIDVETFSMEDIASQIEELLRSYRHFHLPRDAPEPTGEDAPDQGEKEDMEQRARLARDTFQAMFRSRLDEQFLISESEAVVLETLKSWVRDALPSVARGRQVIPSLATCSDLLMYLTSEATSGSQSTIWPYIRKIRVFSNAHILSKGLVLVDLPGLRDLNSARQHITERYLLECDQIFAICNIGRATTDVGVASVFDLAKRTRLSQVGIICTKSDDIRAEEAKKDWKGDISRRIQSMINTITTEKSELRELESILDQEDWSDSEEALSLGRDARQKKASIRKTEFALKNLLMTTRNASVTRGLQTTYRDKVPNNTLQVFCVSNRDYWKHRDDNGPDFLQYLDLSGIKAIRKYCISIVAESQLRIATNYISKDIPAFLADVELWVQSGAGNITAERKTLIRRTLTAIEDRLQRDLLGRTSTVNTMAKSMKREFKERIFDGRQTSNWSEGATMQCSFWSGWHHSSYAAFCRNYGDHCTPAAGAHNWNEEAMGAMVQDVTPQFSGLRDWTKTQHDNVANAVEEVTEWAIELLEDEIGDDSASTALIQALDSHSQLIATDVEDVYTELETNISLLETDALTGIRTSIFGQGMESSYNAARLEYGSGSHQRRKAIIQRGITPERMYEAHMNEFKKRLGALANDFQEDLQSKVETHVNVIRGTLDIIRNDNVALESESDPEFRAHVNTAIRAARERMRGIQETVAGYVI